LLGRMAARGARRRLGRDERERPREGQRADNLRVGPPLRHHHLEAVREAVRRGRVRLVQRLVRPRGAHDDVALVGVVPDASRARGPREGRLMQNASHCTSSYHFILPEATWHEQKHKHPELRRATPHTPPFTAVHKRAHKQLQWRVPLHAVPLDRSRAGPHLSPKRPWCA